MGKVNAIVLLSLYISVNTDVRDLVRVPVLFEHFSEHRQEDKDISFADFIIFHYFSGDIRDADFERDQQLPFKRTHCEMTSATIAVPTENSPVIVCRAVGALEKTVRFTPFFSSSSARNPIWQPPRA